MTQTRAVAIAVEPPTDAELRRTQIATAARFRVASFAVLGERAHLAVALRRRHPLRKLQRWTFDGETDHLPPAACTVLIEIARRPRGGDRALGLAARTNAP